MSINPPSSSDPPSSRSSIPPATDPETRGVRGARRSTISGDVADPKFSEGPRIQFSEGPRIPVDRNVLAVERWAIALARLDVGLIDQEELSNVQAKPEIFAAIRRVPERVPSAWVRWVQRVVRRFRGDKAETPSQLQSR